VLHNDTLSQRSFH